jgi:Cytochrome bd terminal oxidase subunit II
LLPKFVSEGATTYHELRKRGTRHGTRSCTRSRRSGNGNETWLVLIGAGLFAAFPMVYAIFLPAFYLPIALMLF